MSLKGWLDLLVGYPFKTAPQGRKNWWLLMNVNYRFPILSRNAELHDLLRALPKYIVNANGSPLCLVSFGGTASMSHPP